MPGLLIMEPSCSRMTTKPSQQSTDAQIHMDNGNQQAHADSQMQLMVMPSHTASKTWKSHHILEKEEYERVRQRVRHIAPEHFKQQARPNGDPSTIFPQNGSEWTQHKAEITALAAEDREKNARILRDQLSAWKHIPKGQRKIVSKFGKQGKIFTDGMSPVLAVPTIWSAEYAGIVADWPLPAELKWNGDNRESKLARTKVGRFLPPPRAPSQSTVAWHDQSFLIPVPLDQTGPVYTSGPSPSEVYINNVNMDDDPAFEEKGQVYLHLADLGNDLAQKKTVENQPGLMIVKEDDCEQQAMSDIFSQCEGVTPMMESVEVGIHLKGDGYTEPLDLEEFPPLGTSRYGAKPRM
ncbi:hypothetical protein H2204_014478 [Knufia peltigerae]|uniref:Uncharacterized protein n=1 Tax=Knufia peltigerae TaxID=1002370 RepID=A0AA38XKM9_9EURO|nr:hypothetical protein H2204_014478 [Knufia peltigerae]